jgi:hypothetical protein
MTPLYVVAVDRETLRMYSSSIEAMERYAAQIKHPGHVALFEIHVEGFDKKKAYDLAFAKMKAGDYVAIAERHAEPIADPSIDQIDIYSEDALKAAFERGVQAGKEYEPQVCATRIVDWAWPDTLANIKVKYAS